MLPDIACIACVHSVIVMAHPDYGSLILVHLLGDIEGLGRCSYGDLLGIVEACLGGGGRRCRGSEQLLVHLVGQPAAPPIPTRRAPAMEAMETVISSVPIPEVVPNRTALLKAP